MSQDFPDFTRAVRLLGIDESGDLVTVLLDSAGNLQALLKGQTAAAALEPIRVDDDGQLVIIPRGQSGNYMSVDGDGFLTAVLKGIYSGTLHTIGVDAAGRIEAFGLDAEDQWGQSLKIGSGEQAARLGSPSTYDWRGQTLVTQDFAHGKGNLFATTYGTGAEVSVSPDTFLQGGYSLKMLGGSDGAMHALVTSIAGRNPSDRYGLSVCFADSGTYDYVYFNLYVRSGGTIYFGRIRYDPGSNELAYWAGGSTYTAIATVYATSATYAFNWLKVVIDVNTHKYVRVLFNSDQYDIDANLPYTVGGSAQSIEVDIDVYSVAGYNYGIYLDRYVVTVNEP